MEMRRIPHFIGIPHLLQYLQAVYIVSRAQAILTIVSELAWRLSFKCISPNCLETPFHRTILLFIILPRACFMCQGRKSFCAVMYLILRINETRWHAANTLTWLKPVFMTLAGHFYLFTSTYTVAYILVASKGHSHISYEAISDVWRP